MALFISLIGPCSFPDAFPVRRNSISEVRLCRPIWPGVDVFARV